MKQLRSLSFGRRSKAADPEGERPAVKSTKKDKSVKTPVVDPAQLHAAEEYEGKPQVSRRSKMVRKLSFGKKKPTCHGGPPDSEGLSTPSVAGYGDTSSVDLTVQMGEELARVSKGMFTARTAESLPPPTAEADTISDDETDETATAAPQLDDALASIVDELFDGKLPEAWERQVESVDERGTSVVSNADQVTAADGDYQIPPAVPNFDEPSVESGRMPLAPPLHEVRGGSLDGEPYQEDDAFSPGSQSAVGCRPSTGDSKEGERRSHGGSPIVRAVPIRASAREHATQYVACASNSELEARCESLTEQLVALRDELGKTKVSLATAEEEKQDAFNAAEVELRLCLLAHLQATPTGGGLYSPPSGPAALAHIWPTSPRVHHLSRSAGVGC